jgi:hypothetical protein
LPFSAILKAIERFSNLRAFIGIVQGGLFLMKSPLGGIGFDMLQLENRWTGSFQ